MNAEIAEIARIIQIEITTINTERTEHAEVFSTKSNINTSAGSAFNVVVAVHAYGMISSTDRLKSGNPAHVTRSPRAARCDRRYPPGAGCAKVSTWSYARFVPF